MFETLGHWLKLVGRLMRPAPVEIDMAEVHRMHTAGLSWRQIARRLQGPRSTIQYRYQQWARNRAGEAEPQPVPEPALAATPKPPVLLAAPRPVHSCVTPATMPEGFRAALVGLAAPGAAAKPTARVHEPLEAIPEPAEESLDLSGVYGLGTVPVGTRAFFLVHGRQNAALAISYGGEHAIGLDAWQPGYWRLPAFRDAAKIWVVVNLGEDNAGFLRSIAADERLRAMCLIAAPKPWNGVQSVTRERLLAQRRLGSQYSDHIDFEPANGFQPLPTGHALAKWLPKPEPPQRGQQFDPFYQPSWEIPRDWTPRQGREHA